MRPRYQVELSGESSTSEDDPDDSDFNVEEETETETDYEDEGSDNSTVKRKNPILASLKKKNNAFTLKRKNSPLGNELGSNNNNGVLRKRGIKFHKSKVSKETPDDTVLHENQRTFQEISRNKPDIPVVQSIKKSNSQQKPSIKKPVPRGKENPSNNVIEKNKADINDSAEEENEDEIETVRVLLKHEHKKYPCLYCPKSYPKIGRHLEQVHENIVEVAEIVALQIKKTDSKEVKLAKTKERKILFEKLQKKGCFQHNVEVLKDNKGILIPERCPSEKKPHTDYLFCEFCYGLYYKVDLARHYNNCKFLPEGGRSAKPGQSIQGVASMLLPTRASPDEPLKVIISRMLVDDVSLCVRNDRLIVKYGNLLCRKHKNNGNQNSHISNKLRELGKFLIEMRKINSNICNLENCIKPTVFNDVVKAVINLCGWDEQLNTIDTPSLGMKLGNSLKKIASLLKGEAMIEGDESLILLADRFQQLISMRWNDEISKQSRIELEQRKWNKPKLLPFTSDLQILRNHIKSSISSSIDALAKDNTDNSAWRLLATSVLTWLILFNRRRGGEAADLRVEDFLKSRNNANQVNDEVLKSLSPFEKKLCETFTCIEIRGKRGRKVPLMFSKQIKQAINLLLELRDQVGVSSSNPYVFAIPSGNSENNIRGNDALRKHVQQCELAHPEAIYSTNLRKHVATLSQLLNLEERELEGLANYLGHDIAIHREFYRLPENVLMVAKCGKLLVALEQGLGDYVGKKLSEIDVSLAEVEEESSSLEDQAENIEEVTEKDSSSKGKNKAKKNTNMVETDDSELDSDKESGKKKKGQRRPWTEEEKAAVHLHLKDFIRNGKAPRQKDIEPILKKERKLSARSWKDVKNFIHGIHVQQKRKAGILKKSR